MLLNWMLVYLKYFLNNSPFPICIVYICAIFSSPEPSGSQGELIVYPCSGIRCRCRRRCRRRRCRRQQCLNIFSSETALPIKAKLYVEPPWEGGNESLYKWSRSHDQDGRHAHIWYKPLKIFFSRTRSPMILKLGM